MTGAKIFSGEAIRCELVADRIAHVILDTPGESVNKLTRSAMEELNRALDAADAHPDAAGMIISSAKPTFSVGADINEFLSLYTTDQLLEFLHRGDVFRRLESLPMPTAAAITGTAVGGGLELALACSYRLAVSGEYVVGLPDIKLGVIPSWGGTVRLPRVVDMNSAIRMICFCRFVGPEQAREIGLIDSVEPAGTLIDGATGLISDAIDDGRWRDINARKLAARSPGDMELESIQAARRRLKTEAWGFPAPSRALQVIETAAARPLDAAFELERETTLDLAGDPRRIVQGSVGLFFIGRIAGARGKRGQKWREFMALTRWRMRAYVVTGMAYIAAARLIGGIVRLFSGRVR